MIHLRNKQPVSVVTYNPIHGKFRYYWNKIVLKVSLCALLTCHWLFAHMSTAFYPCVHAPRHITLTWPHKPRGQWLKETRGLDKRAPTPTVATAINCSFDLKWWQQLPSSIMFMLEKENLTSLVLCVQDAISPFAHNQQLQLFFP